MSETTPAPQGRARPPNPMPPLVVNIQYVKDLSFEVPGAPQIFSHAAQPAAGRTSISTSRPAACRRARACSR